MIRGIRACALGLVTHIIGSHSVEVCMTGDKKNSNGPRSALLPRPLEVPVREDLAREFLKKCAEVSPEDVDAIDKERRQIRREY